MNLADDIFAPLDLESIAEPRVVVSQADGRVRRVNALAEKLFGYSCGEMEGVPVESLMPESMRKRHEAHRAAYANEPRSRGMATGFKVMALRKDGVTVQVDVSLTLFEFEGEKFVVVGVVEITPDSAADRSLGHAKNVMARIDSLLEKL